MGFVNNFIKRMKTEKQFAKMFYIALAVFVLCVVVIVACVSCSKDDAAAEEGTQQEESATGDETSEEATEDAAPVVDYTVPDVLLEENAYPEVNDIVAKYFNAMTNGDTETYASLHDTVSQEKLIKIEKESAYIDEYDNIKVYTKPGPMSGSYVTFVSYEIKFTGIDSLAPGLTTMYICPREDGTLYLCDGNMSQQDTDYIKAIVAQTDVADLFAKVETEYAEAMDADAALKEFMEGLAAKLDAEVSQAMAQLETETEGGTEEQTEQEPQQPQSQVVEEVVRATDTVNVRASDSENADRIGRVAMGDTVKRLEKKENGWSRVEYQGQEGFIKSEYLEVVGGSDNQETETEEQPQEQEEEQEEASSTDLSGKDSITIKEAVNVRKSASTSADKLGMAYQGETYELIMEQADGWCKIKYKGEVGYVKTEFVE